MYTGKKAVIFDLDGTLIDSLGIWHAVDVELVTRLGRPDLAGAPLSRLREEALIRHRAEENPYVGYCAELGEYCRSPLPGKAIHALRFRISRELLRTRVMLKPGAAEAVGAMHRAGLALAVATTTRKANVDIYRSTNEHIPQLLNFDCFQFIRGTEDVTRSKPGPEVYLKALSRLGVTPAEALVFEDTLQGLKAAQAAGIDTVVIRDKWSEEDRETLKRRALRYYETWEDVPLPRA